MTRWERGSVLLLMPAAVLAVLVLGAIAVDAAVVLLAEREASSLAAAAANDAATAADEAALRAGAGFVLDEDRARRVVLATVGVSSPALDDLTVEVAFPVVDGQRAVRVVVRGRVDRVVAPGSVAVAAGATAVARAAAP